MQAEIPKATSARPGFCEEGSLSEVEKVSSQGKVLGKLEKNGVKPLVKFVGGQIADLVQEWQKLSSEPWLINSVKGVCIPFVELPVQEREPTPYKLSREESQFLDEELIKLLDKCIVEEVEPCQEQVLSNIFLRPKKDGDYRLILDLTWVNYHVEYEHFKMCSIKTALEMMRRNCWMGSIDLKDAYYSVPVRGDQRRFLTHSIRAL